MRRARAEDWLRRLRGAAATLTEVRLEDLPGLGTISLNLNSPLTVLCGGNGAGKSTVLSGILCALSHAHGLELDKRALALAPKLLGGRGVLTIGDNEVQVELLDNEAVEATEEIAEAVAVTVQGTAPPIEEGPNPGAARPAAVVAPAYLWALGQESAELIQDFASARNLSELLAAHEPKQLDVVRSRYLAGRQYEVAEVFELDELPASDMEARPYFRVRLGGRTYGSEAMGQGEMAVLLAQWRLSRIEASSTVLIEEMEASLPPRSQLALFDVVVEHAFKNKLTVLISTHSPVIAATVPRDMLVLMVSDAAGTLFKPNPSDRELATVVGMTRGREWVILVEDDTAQFLTKEILVACDSPLLSTAVIEPVGSDGEIVQALKCVGQFRESGVRFIGAFDGDMRTKLAPGTISSFKSPHVFLPTGTPPDVLLQTAISSDPQAWSTAIGIDLDQARVALAGVVGLDPHDWWLELGKALGKSPWALRGTALQRWLLDPENRNTAQALATELLEKFSAGIAT